MEAMQTEYSAGGCSMISPLSADEDMAGPTPITSLLAA